jgi:hypothetical protein
MKQERETNLATFTNGTLIHRESDKWIVAFSALLSIITPTPISLPLLK